MKRFLAHKDGRLRTGRVAILVFVGIMGCMGAIFQLSKPINETAVRVKHVFESQEEVPEKKEETEQPIKEKDPVEDNKSAEKVEVAENAPDEPAKPSETMPKYQELIEPPAEKIYKNPEPGAEKTAEDTMPDKTEKKAEQVADAAQKQEKADSPLLNPEDTEVSGDKKISETVEKEIQPETIEKEEPVKDEKEITQDTKIADTGIMKLKDTFNNLNPEEKKTSEKLLDKDLVLDAGKAAIVEKEHDLDITGKLGKLLQEDNTGKDNKEKISFNNIVKKESVGPAPVADSNTSIVVESSEYMSLLKGWQSAGKQFDGDTKIPLSVENLENVYELFQMKPVALAGEKFIDLNDGTVIQEDVLQPYSSTVFKVDRPWEKWGRGLKKAGIKENRKVEVRYYMYGFIRNAIYSRVNMCVECMKSKGLIPAGTGPDAIDVLGRAYAVKRTGGGSFGVFVPMTIFTKSGQTVAVDSDCFNGQPDIEALKAAGLL